MKIHENQSKQPNQTIKTGHPKQFIGHGDPITVDLLPPGLSFFQRSRKRMKPSRCTRCGEGLMVMDDEIMGRIMLVSSGQNGKNPW